MLYKYYKAIKTKLQDAIPAGINVEWFNNQYAGTIIPSRILFVEFTDPVPITEISKDSSRADINVRIHVAGKVITKNDNTIPDQQVEDHEEIAITARNTLRNKILTKTVVVTEATEDDPEVTEQVKIAERLKWIRWQHFHKYQGWMVTTIDFEFKSSDFE